MRPEYVIEFIKDGGAIGAAIVSAFYARQASKRSEPTSNGFAKHVQDSLARIEGKVDRHVERHANKEIRHR